MDRITVIVVWAGRFGSRAIPFAEVQESKKVAHNGSLTNGSLFLIAPLTDLFVKMLFSAVSAYAQEEVSSTAQNLVQPEILKIPLKGAGIFGGDVAMVTHLYKW